MRDLIDDLIYEVLVLGLGNLLMSDDGVGILVGEKLQHKKWPAEVLILETGTAIMHYMTEISRSRRVILIDTIQAGGAPGSIYRLGVSEILPTPPGWHNSHSISLPQVIELARSMTGFPTDIIIYGVEPFSLNLGNQLSPVIKNALPKLVDEVSLEIQNLLPRKFHA